MRMLDKKGTCTCGYLYSRKAQVLQMWTINSLRGEDTT